MIDSQPPKPLDSVELAPTGVLSWEGSADIGHGAVFDVRSQYVETFWLPIIGPSSTLLLRKLAGLFDMNPHGFSIEPAELSAEIGLGSKLSRRSPFMRTLQRLSVFQLAYQDGPVLYVKRQIPELSHHRLIRLPLRLQELHHQYDGIEADLNPQRGQQLKRARRLAQTLADLGDSRFEIETQLAHWQFHPAVVWDAVDQHQRSDRPLEQRQRLDRTTYQGQRSDGNAELPLAG